MFQDGLAGFGLCCRYEGSQASRPGTPLAPPRPNSPWVPCAHQSPGARGEPVPDWSGCSQPCPAGREALRNITPKRTQIPAFR